MRNKRLKVVSGRAWRNRNPMLRAIPEEDPAGKTSRMRWRDLVKKDVSALGL